jgi:hypothetical protein
MSFRSWVYVLGGILSDDKHLIFEAKTNPLNNKRINLLFKLFVFLAIWIGQFMSKYLELHKNNLLVNSRNKG